MGAEAQQPDPKGRYGTLDVVAVGQDTIGIATQPPSYQMGLDQNFFPADVDGALCHTGWCGQGSAIAQKITLSPLPTQIKEAQ